MKKIKKIFKNIYWSIKSFLMALFSKKSSYNKLLKELKDCKHSIDELNKMNHELLNERKELKKALLQVKKHYIDMAERYYKFLFSID